MNNAAFNAMVHAMFGCLTVDEQKSCLALINEVKRLTDQTNDRPVVVALAAIGAKIHLKLTK